MPGSGRQEETQVTNGKQQTFYTLTEEQFQRLLMSNDMLYTNLLTLQHQYVKLQENFSSVFDTLSALILPILNPENNQQHQVKADMKKSVDITTLNNNM